MIVRETRNEVEILRIEHGKVNAIDVELLEAMSEQLDVLRNSPPRGVVLTGTGRNFSAGLDLVRLLGENDDYLERLLPALDRALKDLFSFPRPVVAAVNGHAIAGGFVIACACDYRMVAEGRAKFGITELPVGVPFPPAPLEMVRQAVGGQRAREFAYSGRLFPVDEALAIGFANELVPSEELVDRAVATAGRWGAPPTVSFELTKRQMQEPVLALLARQNGRFDDDIARVWGDPEIRAAMQAFIEKTLGR